MVEERQVPKKKDKLPKRDGHDINKCPTAVISDMCTESFNQYTFVLIKNISSAIIKLLGQSKGEESAADLKVQWLCTWVCPRHCHVWTFQGLAAQYGLQAVWEQNCEILYIQTWCIRAGVCFEIEKSLRHWTDFWHPLLDLLMHSHSYELIPLSQVM